MAALLRRNPFICISMGIAGFGCSSILKTTTIVMLHLVVRAVEARQCNKVQVCDATVDAAKNKCRASKKK